MALNSDITERMLNIARSEHTPEHSSEDSPSGQSALADFTAGAWSSFKYSLVQSPLTGASQLVDSAIGTKLEEKVQLFERPQQAETGTALWAGQTIGGTVGGALPFMLMCRSAGPGAAARMETSATYGVLSQEAVLPVLKSMAAGAAYSAVFTPVEKGENFVHARALNSVVGGLTWGALTGTSIGLKGLGMRNFNQQAIAEAKGLTPLASYNEEFLANNTVRALLKNDALAGAAGGVVGGITQAQAHSLLSGRGLASVGDTARSVATFSLGGAFMGGANIAFEAVKPTSGVPGARTLEEMTRMADATVTSQAPPRYFYDKQAASAGGKHWLMQAEESMQNLLKPSSLSPADKTTVIRSNQDLVKGLEAIRDIPQIATMYGSARTKSDTFAYQRGRLTSALLAKEGYAVMTGGGPGMMEAGNRGAYDAGGKSIGVSLKLPNEQHDNGYQTVNLKHNDFGTRMQILREHQVTVVEKGGMGSIYELAEIITHLQTRMKSPTPVYIMGEPAYIHFDHMVKEMEKQGLMSSGDHNLYKLVNSPQEIMADLAARRAAQANGASSENSRRPVLATGTT